MKRRRKWLVILLVSLSLAAVLAGGIYYVTNVQRALWTKAVTDILEVTAQGRHALDTYIEKDQETLHLLASELETLDGSDGAALEDKLRIFRHDGASYICVNLDEGVLYNGHSAQRYTLDEAQTAAFRAIEGRGMREPFLEGRTGVWTVGSYERFFFADGAEGYVQKAQPRAELADRFSLSFYNDAGFSYVVNRAGDILIRSQHRNSNRTFQNLFDIIDLQGNDAQLVASFRQALEDGKQGAARFHYQEEDYVFCYVPMERAEGWYVVSIVPNRVIMEQANSIVQHTQILVVLALVCLLVLTAVFLIYRDFTGRVLQAEEEARKAAESANRAKSRFLSNMSHDIRTPMNAITSMTKLAEEHVDEPERVREYLRNIGLSGQLLVGLINDILDMSKIESGKMILNNGDASLETLLTNLVNIIQPMAAKKNQQFNISLHEVEHETLCFDALRLNQVLINLLSNAVKFTPEGGAISVDVTQSPARVEGCAHFSFRVADNGIGMKPEFLEHVFDSFTREQDSRVGSIEGTGLGMAITKMIVDRMGGAITVESTPGAGTVFTVDLDLRLPSCAEAEAPALPPMRVLVADDDAATCRSAELFFRQLGVEAELATCGAQAVERAAGGEYDLILLDQRMPDMSGIEAARAIRARVGRGVPIVLFSACDWAEIEEEARAAGVDGFLQKPFFKSSLRRCVRQYVLHEASAAERRPERVDLTGRRILLAEDNALNQEIARELLENVGARIEIVDNGLACVERFEREAPGSFDLILMDVQMPVMNGYEATRRIRAMDRPDAAAIPIFAMTADAFAEDVEAAKKAGMNSHLAKPLDIPVMLREIQRYLGPS